MPDRTGHGAPDPMPFHPRRRGPVAMYTLRTHRGQGRPRFHIRRDCPNLTRTRDESLRRTVARSMKAVMAGDATIDIPCMLCTLEPTLDYALTRPAAGATRVSISAQKPLWRSTRPYSSPTAEELLARTAARMDLHLLHTAVGPTLQVELAADSRWALDRWLRVLEVPDRTTDSAVATAWSLLASDAPLGVREDPSKLWGLAAALTRSS